MTNNFKTCYVILNITSLDKFLINKNLKETNQTFKTRH
jgi:hypothetical protein